MCPYRTIFQASWIQFTNLILFLLWYICLKHELWSQRNSRCQRTALKQHSFLGNGRETDNGTTFVVRQQILNQQEQTVTAREHKRLEKSKRVLWCFVKRAD
jgi:hypothetical protein